MAQDREVIHAVSRSSPRRLALSRQPGEDPRIAFVGTYPPTRCGIATFTRSLLSAMRDHRGSGDGLGVVRLVDELEPDPPPEVVYQHLWGGPVEQAVEFLEASDYEAIILQHEYGVYGGPDGHEAIRFVTGTYLPVVVVLHTVLSTPTPHQREVLERIVKAAEVVVVMGRTSRDRLLATYRVDPRKVRLIPHGAGTSGCCGEEEPRTVLTWGLLSPAKGIEWAIDAIAQLRDLGVRYVVAGQTHPNVLKADGEGYRRSLIERARRLGVGELVAFHDAYLDPESLCALIRRAQVVLLPYDSFEQISSGVLVEAIAAGKPVVATSFPQAKELLSGGPGILVPHRDPAGIARALRRVFTDPVLAERLVREARRLAPEFSWTSVGLRYDRLVGELLDRRPEPVVA